MHASILKHTATVTYDDQIIEVDDLIKALNEDGFTVSGEPVYLK